MRAPRFVVALAAATAVAAPSVTSSAALAPHRPPPGPAPSAATAPTASRTTVAGPAHGTVASSVGSGTFRRRAVKLKHEEAPNGHISHQAATADAEGTDGLHQHLRYPVKWLVR